MQLKRFILFPVLLLITYSTALAQEEKVDSVVYQGVEFVDGEWGEILALAELEGKTIFVDAYTDWCRPCKVMDKDVFTRPDIGDFFNTHFLNAKVNMEKGEGIGLAEKYQIIAYPTFLFLNYDGTVVHRSAGYKDVVRLFELGREALDEENNLKSLEKKYEGGEQSPEFLYKFLQTSYEAADGNHVKILESYLATQEDWNTDEVRALIFQMLDTPDSPLFDYLLEHKKAFVTQYGASSVENQIQTLAYKSLEQADDPLEKVEPLFKKIYPTRHEKLVASYKMTHYRQKEDGKGFATIATKYLKNTPSIEEEEINDIAWNFYDLVEDQNQLKTLFKQLKKRVKKQNTYLNNESLALLYAKRGKKRKAMKLANRAINIAKNTKSSFASAEDLIEELKG